MSKFFAFTLVLAVALLTAADCEAQNWRDPALQQPLPQYYPANRYPLGGADKVPTSPPQQPLPATLPSHPQPPQQLKSLPPKATPNPKSSAGSKPKPTTRPKPARPKAKTTAAKSSAKKDAKKANPKTAENHPVMDYSIYRDPSPFPIDPRKPCSVCRRSVGKCSCGRDHQCGIGNQGQPYQDREPGGYSCGKNCPNKRPMFSVYWPKPFSARRTEGHPHRCNCDQCATRINDRFDHLINFKLIDYQRTDNGYCGPGADPYGCLGESKYQALGLGQVSH